MSKGSALGAVMVWSSRHAKAVILVALLLTLSSVGVLLLGSPPVATDVQAGTFPADDEQANAFRELRDRVAGINAEIVYLELQDGAVGLDGEPLGDAKDLESLYDQEALFQYVDREAQLLFGEDRIIDYNGYGALIKLVTSYLPDTSTVPPSEGSYRLPADDNEYQIAQQILESQGEDTLSLYFSEDNRATIFLILYDPAFDQEETAGGINEIIENWRNLEAGSEDKPRDLWKEEYLDSWGIYSWIYRVDEVVKQDLVLFVPIVAFLIVGFLTLTFRDLRRAILTLAIVGLILTWTLATMSLLGLGVGFISMALFPLLLGVGVDYGLHVLHEVEVEREGRDLAEALEETGRKAGLALTIATLTTLSGFAVIMLSRSPMIIEVSVATIAGLSFVYLASLTLVPATLTRLPPKPMKRRFDAPGRTLGFLRHRRAVPAVLLVLILVGIAPFVSGLTFSQDTVLSNLPEGKDSHMRSMFERFSQQMESDGQEAFIHRGDLTQPAALLEIMDIHEAMAADSFFPNSVTSLPFVLELYQTLESGGPMGPGASVPSLVLSPVFEQSGEERPDALEPYAGCDESFCRVRGMTQEDVETAYDSMFGQQRWRNVIASILDPTYTTSWTFSFIDVPASPDVTQDADAAMSGILKSSSTGETDTSYFGTLSALYAINEQGRDWLTLSALVDLFVLATLVALVTKSFRAAFAVSLVLGSGMALWLGLLSLPFVAIEVNFVYLIPLAFITSLGSDYAVHLVLSLQKGENIQDGSAAVARAIIYSAVTTGVAFLVFTFTEIPGTQRMFQATALAILVSALMAYLVIPLFYRKLADKGVLFEDTVSEDSVSA